MKNKLWRIRADAVRKEDFASDQEVDAFLQRAQQTEELK